ncbi:hypothetical protein [Catenulispora subtropica]|uniref:Uncharacterized protein n=1 Tax=Catenulispora subtropica TaxID=450798 RepID=A0ABN2TBI4_9ACTN
MAKVQDELDEGNQSGTPQDREELESSLAAVHQSLADMYRHAVRLMEGPERNRAVVSLIAHAVREISNSLPRHLGLAENVALPARSDLKAPMQKLAELLDVGDPWVMLLPSESNRPDLEVPADGHDHAIRVRQAVDEAVAEHLKGAGNARQIRAFVAAWDMSAGQTPTAEMFGKVFDFFMGYAHLGGVDEGDIPAEAELRMQFARFESIVATRLGDFFEVRDELASILTEANSKTGGDHSESVDATPEGVKPPWGFAIPDPGVVDRVVERLGHPQHRYVFYSGLANPHWVAPLTARKAFQSPPVVDGQGMFRGGGWPEGEYLARVAAQAPTEVIVALRPALASDHPSVQKIVLDIAAQLPAEAIVDLLPTLNRYLQSPWLAWLDPIKLTSLIPTLAEGGKAKKARELALLLYTPRASGAPAADPRTVLDSHWYIQTLPGAVSALGVELKTLSTVIGWLEEWARLTPYGGSLMSMWRHSIENDDQLRLSEPIGHALVDVARDLARSLLDAGQPLAAVVRRVQPRNMDRDRAPIFRRLALDVVVHTLRTTTVSSDAMEQDGTPGVADAATPVEIAFEHLMTPELLRGAYRPEYLLLAQSTLPLLRDDQIEQWRNLLSNPPHLTAETVGRMLSGFGGEPADATNEQLADYIGRWQRDLLAGIGRDALPADLSSWLDELISVYGEPPSTPAEIRNRGGFFTGPTSPLSDPDALSMTPEELLTFAASWQQGDVPDWRAGFPPSYEGLARAIERAVAAKPAAYADHGERFIGMRSSFVRTFFKSLQQAIGHGHGFDWEPVLAVASHVAAQLVDGADEADGDGETWRDAQLQVARFLQAGIEADASLAIPASMYPAAWSVLERLIHSTDPAPDFEEDQGQQPSDAMTLSLNATRPAALRAAIRLLAALARHAINDSPAEGTDLDRDMDDVTGQILETLDQHAGPEADGSLAVAVVFGEGLGLLLSAASQWTADHLELILGPPGGDEQPPVAHQNWFDTAWAVAIAGYHPSRGLFDPLKPWFQARIEQLGIDMPDVDAEINTRAIKQALANHVLMLYVTGQLDDGLQDTTLANLFAHGDSALVREALGNLGWRLRNTQGDVLIAILERLRALWDWRAEQVAQGTADREELLDFYWWAASGHLDPSWWLPHLEAIADNPDFHGHEMLGTPLANAAQEHPEQVLEIFTTLYTASRKTVPSPDLNRHAPAILKPALTSNNPDLAKRARDLIGQLGRDGYTDLMDRIQALPD